ncbi:MAG: hydrogen peroxide-dependent heme synthase [Candidatus Binataceae bacterium]
MSNATREGTRPGSENSTIPPEFPAAPLTLEGYAVLHQMFRLRRGEWRAIDAPRRTAILDEAAAAFAEMARLEAGDTALFSMLGHKCDLMIVHFRRGFAELERAQLAVAGLALNAFLEPASSYVSVIEIGLYEATAALYRRLGESGIAPRSPEWQREIDAELERQREKIAPRLFPRIPDLTYVCFYPMDKKREGADNWYRLPMDERRRLMHGHGMVGRRFAGQVTQIISGSIGFDDWEWGVDLFAGDPMVFKKLVYEMRFDEASAPYAKFGPFHVGLRLAPAELSRLFPG